MADGTIEIDTKINTDGAEKGAKDLKTKLQGLNSVGELKNLAKGSATIAAVATAAKLTTKAIKDTTAAYRTQATAEKQLEAAARNNPYLDDMAVKQLKDYASQLQSISTTGDEQLLPFMAQLATAGRTQTEIQEIMQAALDVSASGMMSLDSAVSQLNATYSGNVGLMGRQISELKSLTKEELENGKAIEIIKQKFSGMAQEVAEATGSSQQLKNAWGDLKEEVGAGFEKALTPFRRALTQALADLASAKKELRETQEGAEAYDEGTKTTETIRAKITATQKELTYNKLLLANYENLTDANKKRAGITEEEVQLIRDKVDAETKEIFNLDKQLQSQKQLEAAAAAQAKIDKEKTDALEEETEAEQNAQKTRDTLRAQYDETIRQAKEQIEQRRRLGENITEEAEAEELLNTATAAYIAMMSDPAFEGNSGNFEHEVAARKEIAQWADTTEKANKKAAASAQQESTALEEAATLLSKYEESSLVEQIDATIYALNDEATHLAQNENDWAKYHAKIEQLEKLKTKTLKEEADKQVQDNKEAAAKMLNNISNYYSQFADITNSITELIQTKNDESTNAELTTLSEQYTSGLISYEDYCNEKLKIEKESEKQTYKIKMWEWTSSLLQATANTAAGIASALAEAGVPTALKIVNAALIGASGAAQVATISANRPTAPAFQSGGIVPGTSYTGDRVTAQLNSAEMVLTRGQQAQLWKMANGNGGNGGVNLNVDVTNNAAAEAQVSTRMTARGLSIVIDKKVNAGFTKGTYTTALLNAQAAAGGNKVL